MSSLGRPSATVALALPYELIEQVISELVERDEYNEKLTTKAAESLMRCSLVNSAFRFCSQSHLFSHLNISDHAVLFDRASTLLSGSERIRSMVRSLSFFDSGELLCAYYLS
jgi:hypothetical protein